MNLPQAIPPEFCRQCRGCCVFSRPEQPIGERSELDAMCRFQSNRPDSPWRPRLLVEEEIALEKRFPRVSFGGQLRTDPSVNGRHACRCLNTEDHLCRIYGTRPLECVLYPFLLSSENGLLRLYAHTACPFVREQRHSAAWEAQVAGLKNALLSPAYGAVLKAAGAAYPDYSPFHDEVELIADILFPEGGGAPALLKRKEELDGWFVRRKPVLSSRSLVNVVAWSCLLDFTMDEVDGNCLVFARQDKAEFLYCPPLGKEISPRAVEAAFARMKGGAARIEAVAEVELAAFDSARYRAHWQGEEYYYERARIASLGGNGYRSKRSDVNGFLKRHSPVFRRFCSADAPSCHDLFDAWLDNRRASYEDDIYRALLVENRPVHRRMIANASRLGLAGRVVEVAGRLAGYTFGYPLDSGTFCVALEVTMPGLKGLPAFIFREFCADAELQPFRFINAMDDFGMPGVAKAKRSWRPAFMEKVYSICLTP